ncbi:hypothetical protein PRZ48_010400 [Zasmidium cellare]|uniref:Uncharacterized protein n=1 Tax=Zasmidium cellare TaxID=395010 RepID=A0ABR0E8I5_ZASCE|nr:hypothetical protein PRZ48_010400 [Zasmidium cellare]
MAETDEDQRAAERIADVLRARLHGEFPYMKEEAMVSLVNTCKEELKQGILKQQPIMAETKSRCDFMRLPPTARNQIYWLAMNPDNQDEKDHETYMWEDGHAFFVIQSEQSEKYGYDPECPTKWWLQPALTKVCRQIRQEALPVWYGNIEFRAYAVEESDNLGGARDRLDGMGQYARMIGRFIVRYDGDEFADDLKEETVSYLERRTGIPRTSIRVDVLEHTLSEDRYSTTEEWVEL